MRKRLLVDVSGRSSKRQRSPPLLNDKQRASIIFDFAVVTWRIRNLAYFHRVYGFPFNAPETRARRGDVRRRPHRVLKASQRSLSRSVSGRDLPWCHAGDSVRGKRGEQVSAWERLFLLGMESPFWKVAPRQCEKVN